MAFAPAPDGVPGNGLAIPQLLGTPVRLRRRFCVPVDAVTPDPAGIDGATVSSVSNVVNDGGPMGTSKVNTCGPGPPVAFTVSVKAADCGHGKLLATVKLKPLKFWNDDI